MALLLLYYLLRSGEKLTADFSTGCLLSRETVLGLLTVWVAMAILVGLTSTTSADFCSYDTCTLFFFLFDLCNCFSATSRDLCLVFLSSYGGNLIRPLIGD